MPDFEAAFQGNARALEIPQPIADGNNEFALALYGVLRHRSGNLFFSPFSVRTALGMSWAGARGETAAQMSRALRLPASDDGLHSLAEIVQGLNAGGKGQHDMTVANSLWSEQSAPLQSAFLELITRRYAGTANLVDFRGGAEAARQSINRWVEDQTNRKIREIVGPGALGADTRLILVNAVYFKGTWVLQFSEALTRAEAFFLNDGGEVRTQLMQQRNMVRYVHADGFQVVDLDYMGGDLSMLLLLPDRRDGLRDLEARLSMELLRSCAKRLQLLEVRLFLPRFTMTWGAVDLATSMRALGMPLAFAPDADFSGINGRPPRQEDSLFISAVLHKAFVEVNEKGTEAAAATAVVHRASSMFRHAPPPVPVFRADHPFLFALWDRRSRTILFLGRMADPTGENEEAFAGGRLR